MSETLKRCPFCGGNAEIKTMELNSVKHYCIECKCCWCIMGLIGDKNNVYDDFVYSNQQDAIEAWNTRIV